MFGELGSGPTPEMEIRRKSDDELSEDQKPSLPRGDVRLGPVIALLATLGSGADALANKPDHHPAAPPGAHAHVDKKPQPEAAKKKHEQKEKPIPIALADTTLGREFEQQLLKLQPPTRRLLRGRWNEIVRENSDIILAKRFHSETGRPPEARLDERFNAILHDPKFPGIVRIVENACAKQGGKLGRSCVYLVLGDIMEESDFNPNDVSSAGAKGLTQQMPNGKETKGFKEKDYFNPKKNIKAGTDEMGNKIDTLSGKIGAALIAYNEGMGHLQKQIDAAGYSGTFKDGHAPTIVELYDVLTSEDMADVGVPKSARYPFRVAFYEHEFRKREKEINAIVHPPKHKPSIHTEIKVARGPQGPNKVSVLRLQSNLPKRPGARGK